MFLPDHNKDHIRERLPGVRHDEQHIGTAKANVVIDTERSVTESRLKSNKNKNENKIRTRHELATRV